MSTFWTNGGGILVNGSGEPILCADCPCGPSCGGAGEDWAIKFSSVSLCNCFSSDATNSAKETGAYPNDQWICMVYVSDDGIFDYWVPVSTVSPWPTHNFYTGSSTCTGTPATETAQDITLLAFPVGGPYTQVSVFAYHNQSTPGIQLFIPSAAVAAPAVGASVIQSNSLSSCSFTGTTGLRDMATGGQVEIYRIN